MQLPTSRIEKRAKKLADISREVFNTTSMLFDKEIIDEPTFLGICGLLEAGDPIAAESEIIQTLAKHILTEDALHHEFQQTHQGATI